MFDCKTEKNLKPHLPLPEVRWTSSTVALKNKDELKLLQGYLRTEIHTDLSEMETLVMKVNSHYLNYAVPTLPYLSPTAEKTLVIISPT